MGLPARADVNISFKKETPEAFHDAETLTKALKEFYGDECHIGVYEVSHNGEGEVYIDLYSERSINLDWQQNLLIKYLKDKCRDEFVEISSSVWVAGEGVYLTEDEIDDYA